MATCGSVKLLGMKASPYGNRVQFSLNLKGIPYQIMEENLFNKSELLLASNPVHKKIPVLIHWDKPISESLVIVEYIDEFWSDRPCNILPSDPFDRAVQRFWAAYIDDKVRLIVSAELFWLCCLIYYFILQAGQFIFHISLENNERSGPCKRSHKESRMLLLIAPVNLNCETKKEIFDCFSSLWDSNSVSLLALGWVFKAILLLQLILNILSIP